MSRKTMAFCAMYVILSIVHFLALIIMLILAFIYPKI